MFGKPGLCGFGSCNEEVMPRAYVIVEYAGMTARFRVCEDHYTRVNWGHDYDYLPTIRTEIEE